MMAERPELKRNGTGFASGKPWLCALFVLACAVPAQAAETGFVAVPVGPEIMIFDPGRGDACDGHDVPDMPLRAFRGVDGRVHAFALHYENRRLSGASILTLRPECAVVYRGAGNPDPAAHDDRAWLAATWTGDGRVIHGLIHHEFQAHRHPGRCRFTEYLPCWWNSILPALSTDGGRRFRKGAVPVAATPFGQEQDQGRHRGFFNPSNIIGRDGHLFALIATTGWDAAAGRGVAQPAGACLFRTRRPDADAGPLETGVWAAFDGAGFGARFPGPDAPGGDAGGGACRVLPPFPAPVGAIVRHRESGAYLAIYQAAAGMPALPGERHPDSGFYLAASRDLLVWSAPVLVLETKSYYDSPCGAAVLRNYPVLIDEAAESRNFEDIGDAALLVFAETRVSGCIPTADRRLLARRIRISTFLRQ